MASNVPVRGTKQEQDTFTEVIQHYDMAREDVDARIPDFDKRDVLFRSHINENTWPYETVVFDPRIFTAIYEKSSRTFANKPKGRLIPREGGDVIGAKICNELMSFQWDENERVDAMPMLAKWAQMDMNARKYGASFGLAKWHYERKVSKNDKKSTVFFDGPNFVPLNNRDCLHNPSYSSIKNWFQHRDYVTLQELKTVNDTARSKPIYKNLDILHLSLREEAKGGGDTRDTNWTSKNKSIKGLSDFLGRDEAFKIVEVVTEYRDDRWITFSPKHGVVLRDIDNPYDHGQIPVVMLRYYPIDDDLYGLSEIEPVEKLQKAVNALMCQYIDAINMSLYAPLKIRSTGGAVQMHTIEFGAGKKWLMNDPSSDIITHDSAPTGVTEFTSTYRFLVSAMQEGLGETSQGMSNLTPGGEGKTATEVRDTAASRSSRDNFNQIFLAEALKKQMSFWLAMNKQFMFSNPQEQQKVIRIVGKDAVKYFQKAGLDEVGLTERYHQIESDQFEINQRLPGDQRFEPDPQDFMEPLYPVQVGEDVIPKMTMEDDGSMGSLILEKDDLSGVYDYIPDIESMQMPDKAQAIQSLKEAIEISLNPTTQQSLAQQEYKINFKELLEDYYEQLGMRDADKYFERLEVDQMQNDPAQGGIDPTGAGATQGVPQGGLNGQQQGIQGDAQAVPNGEAQPIVS